MKKKSRRTTQVRDSASPSAVVQVRNVPKLVQLTLFVRAGGRCEFDGHNKYLLEHELTLTDGNFAEMAHIVAFKEDGPRGNEARPADINDVSNLLLLCPECHKLVDDHPEKYTRLALQGYKKAHEDRIRHVTSLGPNRRTAVLVLKALINGQLVSVPPDQITEAVSPRYPSTKEAFAIDLTNLPNADGAFYESGCAAIKDCVSQLFRKNGEADKAGHVSVFAIGPMPLLICLGRELTNKVASDLYQRHRDTESWVWKTDGVPVSYSFVAPKTVKANSRVALVLSLSGPIQLAQLPIAVRRDAAVYQITLKDQVSATTFLRRKQDLDAFRLIYQEAVATILKNHPALEAIDLFPAVPAPVAVLCGRELLPKVHPNLRVYDYDKAAGGWTLKLTV